MSERSLPGEITTRIEEIYRRLEDAYDEAAAELRLGCAGCPDNCCDSYFLHHTYVEWWYLWQGVSELPGEKRRGVLARARAYVQRADAELRAGRRPQLLCPLNENGLCIVYRHRLMVCRTHGVPAQLVRPDGRKLEFPGCFRCQELVAARDPALPEVRVDRTTLLRQLAELEHELLQGKRHLFPRVRLTIAEMLCQGPPQLPPHCPD